MADCVAVCVVLFCVFPFLKYATDLMVQKYNVDPELAGTIPSLLPLGTLFLTPLFGNVYDRIGKGATADDHRFCAVDFCSYNVCVTYS